MAEANPVVEPTVKPPKPATKPLTPYNIEDPKEGRRIRTYYKSLKNRFDNNIELTDTEKQELVSLGILISNHHKKLKKQEERLEGLRRETLLDLGAAEAQLQKVLNQKDVTKDPVLLEELFKQEDKYRDEIGQAKAILEELGDKVTTSATATPGPSRQPSPVVVEEEVEEGEEGEEGEGDDNDDNDDNDRDDDDPYNNWHGRRSPSVPSPTPPGTPGTPPEMAGKVTGNELLSIPLFTGDETDPDIWLDLIDRASRTYRWDDERKPGAACLRLTDKALTWLDSQKKLGVRHETSEWNAFKTAFLARFKPKDDTIKATEGIMDLKQKAGERAAEFFDRVVLAVELKNRPGFTDAQRGEAWYPAVRNTDIYSFMCAGMLPALRKQVMGSANPPRNIDDLKKMAIETEAAFASHHTINEMTKETAESNGGESKEAREETDGDKLEKLEKEVAAIKQGIRCYKCNKIGHIRRECPQNQGGQGQQQQQPPPQQGWRGRGRGRGRGNNNWRGNSRGRGGFRGRGGGGYNRGRGSYTPAAYFGQPNYGQPNYYYQQFGRNPPQQRFGVNHMHEHHNPGFYDNPPPSPQQPGPNLWEIVNEDPNC